MLIKGKFNWVVINQAVRTAASLFFNMLYMLFKVITFLTLFELFMFHFGSGFSFIERLGIVIFALLILIRFIGLGLLFEEFFYILSKSEVKNYKR